MISFSYTISGKILELKKTIVKLRSELLTTIIPPHTEDFYRYQVSIASISDSLALSQIDATPMEIDKTLRTYLLGMPYGRRNHPWLTKTEQAVLDYNNAVCHIRENWTISPEDISNNSINQLHQLSSSGRLRSENILHQIVDFINAEGDPFIQSALALIIISSNSPFTERNGRTARLVSQLILYKYGLDFRGFLNLNHYLRETQNIFIQFLKNTKSNTNLTLFLEYFLEGLRSELALSINLVRTIKPMVKRGQNQLLPRQKRILSLLEIPDTQITNRQIQKAFKVSQITASRDLAKLVLLGYLFPHGRGRAVYYTS